MRRNRAKVAAGKEGSNQREGTVAPDTEAVSWRQTCRDFVNGDLRKEPFRGHRARSGLLKHKREVNDTSVW